MSERRLVHELLVSIKQGDMEAAGTLYGQHMRGLYHKVRRLGFSEGDAYDIVQETYIKILTNIEHYDESQRGGSTWIWRICRNTAIDIRRKQREIPEYEGGNNEGEGEVFGGSSDNDPMIDPVQYAEWQELCQAVREAVEQLSEVDQQQLRKPRGKAGPVSKARKEALQHLKENFRYYRE